MSKINFENYPPLTVLLTVKLGSWVKDKLSSAYGVVEAQVLSGGVKVHWASGEWTEEQLTDLIPATADQYLDAIRQFATSVLSMDVNEFNGHHLTVTGNNDPISLTTLSLLEGRLLEMAPVEIDGDYEATWETVEETAKQLDAEPEAEEDDIFAAFGLEAEAEGKCESSATPADGTAVDTAANYSRVTVGPDPNHNGFFAVYVDTEIVEQFFETEEDAKSHITNWEEVIRRDEAEEAQAPTVKAAKLTKEKPVCAKCFNVAVNKLSPELNGVKVCKKCHLEADVLIPKPADAVANPVSTVAEDTAETATGILETSGAGSDPKFQSEASTSAQEISAPCATQEYDTHSTSAHTEAGLIDPETGEVLEPSFILRKLGWTEMPALGKTPTRQEVDAFEEKLDQVLDRILSHQEKTARYRAACEKRCAPYDGAAAFWNDQFVVPMAKMLAPHRLPVNKKGEYKSKTMTLASGCLKFTKSGGAFVHDPELVKAYIQEQGIEKFTSIGAKMEAVYSFRKLISALSKGALKDIPGTGIRETNHFASVKVASPAALATIQEEGDDE